jgi:hypothetical protein
MPTPRSESAPQQLDADEQRDDVGDGDVEEDDGRAEQDDGPDRREDAVAEQDARRDAGERRSRRRSRSAPTTDPAGRLTPTWPSGGLCAEHGKRTPPASGGEARPAALADEPHTPRNA